MMTIVDLTILCLKLSRFAGQEVKRSSVAARKVIGLCVICIFVCTTVPIGSTDEYKLLPHCLHYSLNVTQRFIGFILGQLVSHASLYNSGERVTFRGLFVLVPPFFAAQRLIG